MSYCPRCADLERIVREWKLRAEGPGFISSHRVASIGKGPGCAGAYDHGYKSAWRGKPYEQLYTRSDCQRAYTAGYENGNTAFAEAFAGSPSHEGGEAYGGRQAHR